MTTTPNGNGTPPCAHCDTLLQELAELKAENTRLQEALNTRAVSIEPASRETAPDETKDQVEHSTPRDEVYSLLSRPEMQRYSRQMLVPDFGVARQLRLRQARVLIVGAGGLGCPAALYLGGMGIGSLGLVDDDRVERSNLHRQIGHDQSSLGQLKVESLARRVRLLNPDVKVETHATRLTTQNAAAMVRAYDLVLDASDNPTTRYLLNDVCARERKPLVSGSALGLEGQVTVFTYAPDTACYRCLYPTAPRQPQSCEENGVLGVVPGIIGCLQALEAVKVLTEMGAPLSGTQVLFDAYDTQFRWIKFSQQRRADCPTCGIAANESIPSKLNAMGSCAQDSSEHAELGVENRLDVTAFAQMRRGVHNVRYLLLDTRAPHQFEMVHFPEAINVPFDQLRRAHLKGQLKQFIAERLQMDPADERRTLLICRRGVDSVAVASWMLGCGWTNVFNVEGGYTLYADEHCGVDKHFPMY